VTPTVAPRSIAAFFDLDRTLLRVNSARLWVQHERQSGRVTSLQLAQVAVWLFGYTFGVVDMNRALGRAVAMLKGQSEAELARRTRDWYANAVFATILPQGREAVAFHRNEGHYVVLLTSSSPYLSEPIQLELGLDHVLCNRFEVADGIFTGQPILPMCFGAGKVLHARAWADKVGVDFGRSYFYTDSLTDLPMLEAVKYPRVINPDPRLRRVARRRGWPIEDWR